ncbi:MAG TPA: class I SAM-dependent methyltransferase [Anaerolineales bacterium]|nr:class I SAM-dependent methyltransferase [Anaerolineales bacterium]
MGTKIIQAKEPSTRAVKAYKGMAMEGPIASWYARIRNEDPQHQAVCRQVSEILPGGSHLLEVAPGPGYLSIELARLGRYHIVGLDISESFVRIARQKASQAGVSVDFRHGNASDMPFESGAFDFIVCVAAFKNFTEPVQAIREMHRVLKPGGRALISDLRGDASTADINGLVDQMGLNPINRMITKATFKHVLLKNAYTRDQIERMVSQTEFSSVEIREDNVGMEIWLTK